MSNGYGAPKGAHVDPDVVSGESVEVRVKGVVIAVMAPAQKALMYEFDTEADAQEAATKVVDALSKGRPFKGKGR